MSVPRGTEPRLYGCPVRSQSTITNELPVPCIIIIIFHGSTTLVAIGLLTVEVPQSNSDTPQSVGLL